MERGFLIPGNLSPFFIIKKCSSFYVLNSHCYSEQNPKLLGETIIDAYQTEPKANNLESLTLIQNKSLEDATEDSVQVLNTSKEGSILSSLIFLCFVKF